MRFARKVGHVQAQVLLTVLYFVVMAPFGVAVRLFADPLRIRRPRETAWTDPSP